MSVAIDDALFDWLYECLHECPDGMSEHELLKQLIDDNSDGIWADAFRNNHALFKAHFLLFHILYQLRNRLLDQKQGCLEINPIMIRLLPYREGDAGLDAHDPLMDYYLDFSNLENTSAREVDEMLAGFYIKLNNKDKRHEALEVLGLQDPVDDRTIKQQYRRLAMEHHPDRGGDNDRLQRINSAVKILIG
jgi:hypothetical protein